MDIVSSFRERIRAKNLSVVLPEGRDERIIRAARILQDEAIARPIVLGRPEQIDAAIKKAGVNLDGIRIIDPKANDMVDVYAEAYSRRRSDVPAKIARHIVVNHFFMEA